MTERRETIGTVIYSVAPRGGIKTGKPSVVEMSVDHRLAAKIYELFDDIKAGKDPSGDMIGVELVAVYHQEDKAIEVDLSGPVAPEMPDHMDDTHPEDSQESDVEVIQEDLKVGKSE